MKNGGVIPQYILCVVLTLAAAAAACFANVMNIYTERLDLSISQINNEEHHYDYEALLTKVRELRNTAETLNITPSDKKTAMTEILEYADLLNEKYGAVIADNPLDANSVITVPILMSYTPANAADFLDTLNMFINKEKPAVFISELSIEIAEASRGIYAVKMRLELSKPYLEEAK